MSAAGPAYRYRATVVSVHDGDTFTAKVDLGFRAALEMELRIADLWAPELDEPGGPEAQRFLSQLLIVAAGGQVIVETRKVRSGRDSMSFARYVADVTLPGGADVAEVMIAQGHGTLKR